MKIAFVPPGNTVGEQWASVDQVRSTTADALARRHELRTYPPEYHFASASRRRELIKAWLGECDAIVGGLDDEILQVRRELDRCVPWSVFMLGCMPRGAPTLASQHRYLHTRDVLVCTSTADAALSSMFFPNATVRVVPFAVDEAQFFRVDDRMRAATRARFGIGEDDKVLLYSGRISLEKNIHTVLKTFKVVLNAVPDARLVIAGGELNLPFREFGILSIGIKRTLGRLCRQLGLDDGRVSFTGRLAPDDLRALYGAADVLINLTLHHDENFGYAQVEAMACGLPVVGSAWGGLKDTVTEGVTGMQVPAVVTAAGVKVDWWAAANSVVELFGAQHAWRERCREVARERYSLARYADNLHDVVVDSLSATHRCEPLALSEFARNYWATCARRSDDAPPYRRGPHAFRLYRELIAPYGSTCDANGSGDAWLLAAPLRMDAGAGRMVVNDPICPLSIDVPESLVSAVLALSSLLADHPLLTDREAIDLDPAARSALAWMHETGLVLRTRLGRLDPRCASPVLGQPLFEMHAVDHDADVIWLS
jgi:glycosyltransferase involved in cell wall biosynthesis